MALLMNSTKHLRINPALLKLFQKIEEDISKLI